MRPFNFKPSTSISTVGGRRGAAERTERGQIIQRVHYFIRFLVAALSVVEAWTILRSEGFRIPIHKLFFALPTVRRAILPLPLPFPPLSSPSSPTVFSPRTPST